MTSHLAFKFALFLQQRDYEKALGSIEDLNEQCAHCNDRKYAAKTASETCDKVSIRQRVFTVPPSFSSRLLPDVMQVFLCVYLGSNPVETHGVISDINGSRFFMAVLPEWGLDKKIYVSDLGGAGEFDETKKELTIYPVPEEMRSEEDADKRLAAAKETEQSFTPEKVILKNLMPFKARIVARLDKLPIDFDIQMLDFEQWKGPLFQSRDDDDE